MSTKNQLMSATERGFWRDVLLAMVQTRHVLNTTDLIMLMELADVAVRGLRERSTWSKRD